MLRCRGSLLRCLWSYSTNVRCHCHGLIAQLRRRQEEAELPGKAPPWESPGDAHVGEPRSVCPPWGRWRIILGINLNDSSSTMYRLFLPFRATKYRLKFMDVSGLRNAFESRWKVFFFLTTYSMRKITEDLTGDIALEKKCHCCCY